MGQNWPFLVGNIVAPLAFSYLICDGILVEQAIDEMRDGRRDGRGQSVD